MTEKIPLYFSFLAITIAVAVLLVDYTEDQEVPDHTHPVSAHTHPDTWIKDGFNTQSVSILTALDAAGNNTIAIQLFEAYHAVLTDEIVKNRADIRVQHLQESDNLKEPGMRSHARQSMGFYLLDSQNQNTCQHQRHHTNR